MNWRDLIGNLLEKFDSPAPPPRPIADPFNYALYLSLRTTLTDDALQCLMEKFPTLPSLEATRLLKKCDALIHEAVLIYYKVRDSKLTEQQAEAQVKQTAPEIDQQNFSLLRARCHMVASK